MKKEVRRFFRPQFARLGFASAAVLVVCHLGAAPAAAQSLRVVISPLVIERPTEQPSSGEGDCCAGPATEAPPVAPAAGPEVFSTTGVDIPLPISALMREASAKRGRIMALDPAVVFGEPKYSYRQSEMPGFQWGSALKQSLLFLAMQHTFRIATEPSTRAEFKGQFWPEYFRSVKNTRGWGDGDEFLINYIGHPMGGSVAGFIQVQNDPKGRRQEVALSNKDYWRSRLKAMGWAAAYSTLFELSPVSEASLGNVGLYPSKKSKHPMGYVDLVMTPIAGTGWLIGEDLLDKYLIRRLERWIPNRNLTLAFRSFLNPTRSFSNMLRGNWWWRREDRF